MSKKTTINDIAMLLGVSKSTVSRALSDSSQISQKTKDMVLRLVTELNFKPSLQARSLRGDKSYIAGIVVPKIAHTYFSSAISGIQDELRKHGYSAFICESNESIDEERRVLSELMAANVDGIIMSISAQTNLYDHIEQIVQQGVPVVFFDRVVQQINCSKVRISHSEAACKATKHLIDKGCRNIYHFSGPLVLEITQSRINGFKRALSEAFIPFSYENIIEIGYQSEKVSLKMTSLIKHKKIDGITCFNDEVAVETIKCIKKCGLRVPDDIKVIGFNNEAISEIIEPALTTINHPADILGMHAAQLLMKNIENKGKVLPSEIIVDTELIVRGSSGF